MKWGGKFSLNHYRRLLRKYKFRKPEKIPELLEKEPDPIIDKREDSGESEIFDEIHAALDSQNFSSIEEAQTFLNDLVTKKNLEPIPEFLGLSPEQMYRILHRPFAETADILTFNRNFSKEDLVDLPIVKESIYFLNRLYGLQPLKATAKGNLPQAFAREMHDRFSEPSRYHFTIRSEEEDRKLLALRHILEMTGWMKKRNQKFSLTNRGERVVKNGFSVDDFYNLLETYTRRYNWAFRDLYPQFEIIQEGFLFSCYILNKKAKAYIQARELASYFIQAFPEVLKQVRGISYWKPEEEVSRAFCLRFIERFCQYFGLVTIQRKEDSYDDSNYLVKVSPFFGKLFHWNIDLTGGS